MASLRVFSALNMPLWLGGTRSAKASQSMAFRATRRPAILTVCKGPRNFQHKHTHTQTFNEKHTDIVSRRFMEYTLQNRPLLKLCNICNHCEI